MEYNSVVEVEHFFEEEGSHMSEQDGTQPPKLQRRSRKTNTANHQHGQQAPAAQRPLNQDTKAWPQYWAKVQPEEWFKAWGYWRTEPEIDEERQAFLTERRSIKPAWEQGIYPFKGIEPRLTRADVEWLLATHEDGQGPVDWNDEHQRERFGLDLRGADLRSLDLCRLPLARLRGGLVWDEYPDLSEKQRLMAAVSMQEADLRWTHLEGAILLHAELQDASLHHAHLTEAYLYVAHMQDALLHDAHLERADLGYADVRGVFFIEAHLEGVDLRNAELHEAHLDDASISDEKRVGPWLADVQWGATNLAVVKWSLVEMLGDEYEARQKTEKGLVKDRETRQAEFEAAVRATRLLAITLQAQGLNEVAARFAYRAQGLARAVLWFQMRGQRVPFRQRAQSFGAWLFSWLLNVVAGYGYRPLRCFAIYLLALAVFTLAHFTVGAIDGQPLTFLNAVAVSVQSLHGRLFSFQSGDPQTLLNTIEAFVGLFIEAIVVAVITQRILGK